MYAFSISLRQARILAQSFLGSDGLSLKNKKLISSVHLMPIAELPYLISTNMDKNQGQRSINTMLLVKNYNNVYIKIITMYVLLLHNFISYFILLVAGFCHSCIWCNIFWNLYQNILKCDYLMNYFEFNFEFCVHKLKTSNIPTLTFSF